MQIDNNIELYTVVECRYSPHSYQSIRAFLLALISIYTNTLGFCAALKMKMQSCCSSNINAVKQETKGRLQSHTAYKSIDCDKKHLQCTLQYTLYTNLRLFLSHLLGRPLCLFKHALEYRTIESNAICTRFAVGTFLFRLVYVTLEWTIERLYKWNAVDRLNLTEIDASHHRQPSLFLWDFFLYIFNTL